MSLQASIVVSVYGPPRFYFEPLKPLNLDFNADPDPAVHCNADMDAASFFYEVVQPEVNEKDVETMVKMGFPRDQCIQELRYYHQSVR